MNRQVNPYIAGAPLRGETGFFGRQDTLDWVTSELRNPATNALVLFGQRRIGKTSLLLQLQRTLLAADFLPVYFDLQDQAKHPLKQVLADIADTIAEQSGLEPPAPAKFDDRGRFFHNTFLPKLYEALGGSRRPVFLMDEFDVLNQVAETELPDTAAAKALFPFLRQLMIEEPRLAFVFVVGRRAEDLALDFTATFKASLVREVWTLDQASAEALARQAQANNTLRFTDAAVLRTLHLTNCHPYLTQLLCQRVWERAYLANPTSPPLIDASEVESALPNTLEAGQQALVWLWNGLSPAEKIYAAALAETSEEGQTISEDRVIQMLTANAARLRTRKVELAPRDLVSRRVLETVEERQYRFAIEIFRRWVREHKPLREVKDELDQINPLAEQLFNVGQGFSDRQQWAAASRFFHDALETNPNHFRARLNLGEAMLELGRIDEAVVELEQAYELDHEEARLPLVRGLIAQAKTHDQAGNEDGALTASARALELSPTEGAAQEIYTRIWSQRGDEALKRRDYEAATSAYQKADNTEKLAEVEALQFRVVRQLKGLVEQQRWTEALRLATALLAEEGESHQETAYQYIKLALYSRGQELLEQGELEAAYDQFYNLFNMDPGYRDIRELCADTAYRVSKRMGILFSSEHRVKWLENTLSFNPQHKKGRTQQQLDEERYHWAEELLMHDKQQAAIVQLEKVSPQYKRWTEVSKMLTDALYTLGDQARKSQQWQEAIQWWEKALDIDATLKDKVRWRIREAQVRRWIRSYESQIVVLSLLLTILAFIFSSISAWPIINELLAPPISPTTPVLRVTAPTPTLSDSTTQPQIASNLTATPTPTRTARSPIITLSPSPTWTNTRPLSETPTPKLPTATSIPATATPSRTNTRRPPTSTLTPMAKRAVRAFFCFEGDICVDYTDGSQARMNVPKGFYHFTLSPDGRRVAFCYSSYSSVQGGPLHVINSDGSGLIEVDDSAIRSGEWPYGSFTWSPDSTRIAFARQDGVYVVNADGSNKIQLTKDGSNPIWFPDSSRIMVTKFSAIYVAKADGSGQIVLTLNGFFPALSPDGRRIAFDSRRGGNTDIFVINADGSGEAQLTNHPSDDWWPTWLPDGRIVFYSGRDGEPRPGQYYPQYVMNADGSNQVRYQP